MPSFPSTTLAVRSAPLAASSFFTGLSARQGEPYHERAFASGGPAAECSWGWFHARRLRYDLLWGQYEGTVYRSLHRYADELKEVFDLYKYVRPIFNPTYRDVEFWTQHLMGGSLDRDAGDGTDRPTCLPIITDNDAIRPAVAMLWAESNWQIKKEVWTRFGAAMADAPLMIVDDAARQKVFLRPFHPGTLLRYDRDEYGNCKGYVIQEVRDHPEDDGSLVTCRKVVYEEVCERVGSGISYTTYLNAEPYDWRSYPDGTPEGAMVGPTWSEDYGFVPLVLAQHRDIGLGWGMAEMHPTLPKLYELDDVASKLSDAIRKSVDPRFFVSGVPPEDAASLDFAAGDGEDDDFSSTQSGVYVASARATLDALYVRNENAKLTPMLANTDIAASSAHLMQILASIESDHLELAADLAGLSASGKARRVAQERVEALVAARRAGYDDALIRAHKMAISIAAVKGYPMGAGFNEFSFDRGELDHSFGDRPVFAIDSLDRLEEAKARADVFKVLIDGGMPIGDAAEEAGYPPERVAGLVKAQGIADAKAQQAADAAMAAQAQRAKVAAVAMPGLPTPSVDANGGTGQPTVGAA